MSGDGAFWDKHKSIKVKKVREEKKFSTSDFFRWTSPCFHVLSIVVSCDKVANKRLVSCCTT